MPIPPEINALVERLDQELTQIEEEATAGLTFARVILNRFPDNFTVIQLFAFLNNAVFFVETSKRWISTRVEGISAAGGTNEAIQEAGEDLAMELGRALETKIRVSRIKTRLENLQ